MHDRVYGCVSVRERVRMRTNMLHCMRMRIRLLWHLRRV